LEKVRNHGSDGVVHIDFLFRLLDAKFIQVKEVSNLDILYSDFIKLNFSFGARNGMDSPIISV
jgi:hypothetical protein